MRGKKLCEKGNFYLESKKLMYLWQVMTGLEQKGKES